MDYNWSYYVLSIRVFVSGKTGEIKAVFYLSKFKEYKILYEFGQYLLDYREHLSPEVRWTDRIMSQSGDWSGNVFDFFVWVSAKLTLDLKKPFKLVNMVRQDETLYMMPHVKHWSIVL